MRWLRVDRTCLGAILAWSAGCVAAGGHGPARAEAEPFRRQSSLLLGARSFPDDGFGRMEDQIDLGFDYSQSIGLDPVWIEGGLQYSYDTASDALMSGQGVELRAESLELSAGLLAATDWGMLRPYAGLGASALFVQMRGLDRAADEIFNDQGATAGGYLKAGLLLRLSSWACMGLEYRHLEAGDVTLDGREIDASYDQVALVLAAGFQGAE